jgi:hypothetical protein
MFAVAILTIFEHRRTIRPSTLICLYLLASIIADSVQLRTLQIRGYSQSISAIISAGIICKSILLLLESFSKQSYLEAKEDYGPEEVTGVFSRSVLWWINSLFLLGNRKILSLKDLFPLDHELYSEVLQRQMKKSWKSMSSIPLSEIFSNCYQDRRPGNNSLLYAIISCLRWGLLRTIFPRAALIGFKFSQTFLITAAIKYLDTPSEKRNINHAYGLIGAATLIYLGLAVRQK